MSSIENQNIKQGAVSIKNFLPKIGKDTIRKEIISGLKAPQKYISPKFFYDQKGSELFEEITFLDEYYPGRCEKEILSNIANKLDIDFKNLDIIELGSGDSSKIRTILRQLPTKILETINYYPVDISQSAIENALQNIKEEFDLNNLSGIVADFFHHHEYEPKRNQRLFCFLGSTIGNFTSDEVEGFMKDMGDLLEEGDGLLLGVDLVKDISIIENAYNDQKGITARFNKNILNSVNQHIGSNFNPRYFEHLAFYNISEHRIEMHLKAKSDMTINIASTGENIQITEGESLHTENSYKFSTNRIEKLGSCGGLYIKDIFYDSKEWFGLVYFKK